MKKVILFALISFCLQVSAQTNDEQADQNVNEGGFKKEKLFTGGSANVGLSSYYTSLGIAPQLGYSLTDWADAGIIVSVNYNSQKDYATTTKLRQTVIGPGAFVRLFPVNFLYATAQYEYNLIREKYIPAASNGSGPEINNVSAGSLLLGGGYAGGRYKGSNTYYFLSVAWDVLGEAHSPYIDGLGRSFPIIRAGYNIGLFQGKNRK